VLELVVIDIRNIPLSTEPLYYLHEDNHWDNKKLLFRLDSAYLNVSHKKTEPTCKIYVPQLNTIVLRYAQP